MTLAADLSGSVENLSVIGEGVMAEALRARLDRRREWPIAATWDHWTDVSSSPTRQDLDTTGSAWLPVYAELDRVVIGPWHQPGRSGCVDCFGLRRRRAERSAPWRDALVDHFGAQLREMRSPALDEVAVMAVAAATQAFLEAGPEHGVLRTVGIIDLRTLELSRHHLLPEPLCPSCGDLPEDRASDAQHDLQPRHKLETGGARERNMLREVDDLLDLYVDPVCGMIREVSRGAEGGLVMAGASMPLRFDNLAEPGYGRSRDYRTSTMTAVLEALERYAGVDPGGRHTSVRGSLRELGSAAVDPRGFGVHPDESYDHPDFRYSRFDPDRSLRWVWAHSCAHGEPRLVPESLAYYYTHRLRPEDPTSFYEVSNGCALGSSWEEAALHGVMETVERDAFLMTWYTRMVPRRIDLSTAEGRRVPTQAAVIEAETGYEVMAFDITTDYGVPAVWTMAVSRDGRGPRALCTAGAGLDVEAALLGSMNELGPILTDVIRRYETEEARAHEMVDDPYSVVTMPDHSALYSAPEAFERLEFLLAGDTCAVEDVGGPSRLMPTDDDIAADLEAAAARLGEVLVVDQTTPEHAAAELACVKVLVPGAVPMTFGYRNRRIDGLDRLLTVPHTLGHAPRPLRRSELNPHPHPFP